MLQGQLLVLKPQKELIALHFSSHMQRRFNKLRAKKTPIEVRSATDMPWTGLSTVAGETIREFGVSIFIDNDQSEWPSQAFTVLNSKRR